MNNTPEQHQETPDDESPLRDADLPSQVGISVAEEARVVKEQMRLLIGSGLPMLRALRLIEAAAINPSVKKAFEKIADSIEMGGALYQGIGDNPGIFSEFETGMIQYGESSGTLDLVFDAITKIEIEKNGPIPNFVPEATQEFCFKLGLAIKCGMPILDAIRCSALETSPAIQEMSESLFQNIRKGDTFCHPLEDFPDLFSPMTINVLKVGEETGDLDVALLRIARKDAS